MNATDLINDREFHWLVKLGLWEQALIHIKDHTFEFKFFCAGVLVSDRNSPEIFYVSSEIQSGLEDSTNEPTS